MLTQASPQKQTKNTWHRPDPSFTYLLSFFLLLTALAWGLAYAPSFGAIVRLSLLFIFVHFIGSSLLVSTVGYFTIPRLFGPDGAAASLTGFRGGRGRRRGAAQGLFTQPGEKDQLEFGYCFDTSGIESGILPSVSTSLRGPVPAPPAAPAQPEQLPGHFPRKHPLLVGHNLLHLHHISRIQCASVPPQHGASAAPHPGVCSAVAGEPDCGMGDSGARPGSGRTVLGRMIVTAHVMLHTSSTRSCASSLSFPFRRRCIW
ncbi:uncharacterized protein An11g10950 [Aspergillus niger]|uniref:Contig An11c0390, genomic contig n=2 Tax=Aspergillus niger TaxID=5061 RepID=A2QY13_ASPNC|nr:uncharacterized protein An11g10950 [Aspergillus niger]CAK40893.1 unnamed protein product [Aspergillus niger]